MGGSAQFRKKLQEKSKPQTGFEQVRARFGDSIANSIKGENEEGIARGVLAAADLYGDDVINRESITNTHSHALGTTNTFTGKIVVDGEQSNDLSGNYSLRGKDSETDAALNTAHELTHRATDFAASKEVRVQAALEDSVLRKYNKSREDYANLIRDSRIREGGDMNHDNLRDWLMTGWNMPRQDAGYLAKSTTERWAAAKKFCISVVNQAATDSGLSHFDLLTGISDYAAYGGPKEAVAEANSDILVNGANAKPESKWVYNAFNKLRN
jgi:hypothetical protein